MHVSSALNASFHYNKFSPGFTLSRHSSPSFGSQLRYQCSVAQGHNPPKLRGGTLHAIRTKCNLDRPVLRCLYTRHVVRSRFRCVLLLMCVSYLLHTWTHIPVELLGPCFKTGRTVAPSCSIHNVLVQMQIEIQSA